MNDVTRSNEEKSHENLQQHDMETMCGKTGDRMIIKEGSLVKKGHKRHNWKTRWFVLYEDCLCYYKSKKETSSRGEINLRGCSIVSPCPEYTKKDCVFRLIEHSGREYLVRSANKQDREDWTTSVAEIIRKLEMIPQGEKVTEVDVEEASEEMTNSPSIFQTKVSHAEMLEAMQDTDAGIPLQNFDIDQCIYKHCFTGKDIVDWLLDWAFVNTRTEGAFACGELLETAHLHPVGPISNSSFKRKNARRIFSDNEDALYRFSALTKSEGLDMVFEDDSSDSEDESAPFIAIDSGEVVKEGFLLKKGHVRHNWKFRKFLLRENPNSLVYHKPSKLKVAKGRIPLDGSTVNENPPERIDKDQQCLQGSCVKAASLKVYRHQFEIETKKGILYRLKADSEEEKRHWVKSLRKVLDKKR